MPVNNRPVPLRLPGPAHQPSAKRLAKLAAKRMAPAKGHDVMAAHRRRLAETDLANASTHLRMAELHEGIAEGFRADRDPRALGFVVAPPAPEEPADTVST